MRNCERWEYPRPELSELIGKTFSSVTADDELVFKLEDGTGFILHHHDDCCESVDFCRLGESS